MITAGGRDIEYQESGEGPPILFIPGSYSTPAAWRPIQKHLPDCYRFVSFSLCGYGATPETRTWDDCGPEHHLDMLEAVANHIGEPCHLVGHSFGAAIAQAGVLAGKVEAKRMALFEANSIALLKESDRPELHDEVQEMRRAFEQAYLDGEPDAAARIIDYWGGADTYATLPDAVRDYCRATTGANALDWHGWAEFAFPANEFTKLDIPVLLVRGGLSNEATVEIARMLVASLPDSRSHVVDGASHFLISTHAEQCARLLAGFLSEVDLSTS